MELSGIYDSGPMQPVFRPKDTVAILSRGEYRYFIVDYQEGIPPSPASIVDFVPLAGLAVIAANATIQKQAVAALALNSLEFVHFRWEPIDFVEGILWQLGSTLRMTTRGITARVNRFMRAWDPWCALTTFFILGDNLDVAIEVRNPLPVALPAARFQFWGDRSSLKELAIPDSKCEAARKDPELPAKLKRGDRDTVKNYFGPVTWIPAEGKA